MINQYILHIKSSIQLGNHAGSDNALLEPKHQNTPYLRPASKETKYKAALKPMQQTNSGTHAFVRHDHALRCRL
jgi:hypothetical protein